jgi:hypothetical protein
MEKRIALALALGVLAAPAWGRPGLEGRLRSLEKRPRVSRAMALLARIPGRALLIRKVGARALLLTPRGFAFSNKGASLDATEKPRYKGFMPATGTHDVYNQPLLPLARGWRRAVQTQTLERSVLQTIRRSRRDLAQDRIQEWNPVTGDNGSALVLVRRTLVGF